MLQTGLKYVTCEFFNNKIPHPATQVPSKLSFSMVVCTRKLDLHRVHQGLWISHTSKIWQHNFNPQFLDIKATWSQLFGAMGKTYHVVRLFLGVVKVWAVTGCLLWAARSVSHLCRGMVTKQHMQRLQNRYVSIHLLLNKIKYGTKLIKPH